MVLSTQFIVDYYGILIMYNKYIVYVKIMQKF